MTDELLAQCAQLHQLVKEYQARKQEKTADKDLLKNLNLEIKTVKKNLKATWKDWKQTSKDVLASLPYETNSQTS